MLYVAIREDCTKHSFSHLDRTTAYTPTSLPSVRAVGRKVAGSVLRSRSDSPLGRFPWLLSEFGGLLE